MPRTDFGFSQAPARRRSSRNVFNQVLAVTAMQRIPDADVTPEEGLGAQDVGIGSRISGPKALFIISVSL